MRNLKKVIALVAVFAMMVSTVAFAASFSDVAEDNSYYEAIETLNKLGILTGDDNDNDGVMDFRPDDSITRAEIAVIVARIQGQTGAVAQTNTIFTDVPSTHWASGYIASATNMGIVNGYGDGTFGPDDSVLYQDVIKMLMETLGYKTYAASNGGYPTGYILAAQRYGVLDGVVGGVEGQEATRGQVAQMTNNAIDTPLMERYTYGGSDQYVIWDGESWSPRRTLMNTALGITKIRGIVVENDVTSLAGSVTIDTEARETVRVYVEDNYLGTNDTTSEYPLYTTATFYAGDTDASDYLGYDVVLYARDNANETDEIVSITLASGRNTTISFTLDQFDSYDEANNQLAYMRNETDRSATRVRLQQTSDKTNYGYESSIIYNGVAFSGSITDMFGSSTTEGMITNDTLYSGQVTLVDNDDTSGYDVIFVDVATAGVVQEVSTRGIVTFKNTPEIPYGSGRASSINRLDFGTSDTSIKIDLTKDGQAYDYTALKEWDVLSIIGNNTSDAAGEYYQVEVLDSTAVTGTISRVASSDSSAYNYNSDTGLGEAFTIDGVEYDVAQGVYSNGTLRAGAYGTFYIDNFGKIVAYNRQAGGGTASSDNYAYIVNAQLSTDGFTQNIPSLQFIYKDGTINTVNFASTVTIDYPSNEILALTGSEDVTQATIRYSDYTSNTQFERAIQSLAGRVVTMNATDGYVRQITMATDTDDYNSSFITASVGTANASTFEEDTREMRIDGTRRYDIPDDALVFFIGDTSTEFQYGEIGGGSVDDCSVGTGESLMENSGFNAVVYTDSNEDVQVVVMYNTNAGVGASTGIAYITSIGRTSVDGTTVLSVSYYQDGEMHTAVADSLSVGQLTENTAAGSLFKFGLTGDTITTADPYLTFNSAEGVRDQIMPGDDFTSVGMPKARTIRTTGSSADEDVYYGAVINRENNRLTIAPVTEANGLPDVAAAESVNMNRYSTVNYYIYDPTRSGSAKFQLGSFGDIYCDTYLTNRNGRGASSSEDYEITFGSFSEVAPAWGMLDYVYVRGYDNKADVVDYTTWEYDYEFNRVANSN